MTKNKFLTATREDLGSCLHTALRKYCDSNATSIAWNVIHLLKPEVWAAYLDAVWGRLQNHSCTNENRIAYALRAGSLEDWQIVGDYAGVTLQCAFKLFDRSDWHGYAVLLYDSFSAE